MHIANVFGKFFIKTSFNLFWASSNRLGISNFHLIDYGRQAKQNCKSFTLAKHVLMAFGQHRFFANAKSDSTIIVVVPKKVKGCFLLKHVL